MPTKLWRVAGFVLVLGMTGSLSLKATGLSSPTLEPANPLIGTLESNPAQMEATNRAGARGVVIGISWDRYEPREGIFDPAYLNGIREKIDVFHSGGKLIVLDLGVQYPPQWIFDSPSSRFINQYGDSFDPGVGNGNCGVNLVFSREMRDKFEFYIKHLLDEVGGDCYAIRLGGGRYGELGYPINTYKTHSNCYWAFDPTAQGQRPGLPPGEKPCPVSGWIPGMPSPNHESARQFLDWYMLSMENYHDWQIATVRKYFAGPLFMLYPSTGGLRPGQLEAAVTDDCNGSTGPEKTGEVGRGYDTARFVAGIADPQVVVYSTWIDGFPGSDDSSLDPKRWSPGHYLANLAGAHHPPLLVGGENTGHPDDLANMQLTFQRMRDEHLCVMFWAFEPSLFDRKKPHATIEDFKSCASEPIAPSP